MLRCSDPTILIHHEKYDTSGIGADRSQAAGGPGERHSDVLVTIHPGIIIEESGHNEEERRRWSDARVVTREAGRQDHSEFCNSMQTPVVKS